MMNKDVNVSGSLRARLALTLIIGLTLLTVLLFFIIRNYAVQIAQQSQDSILGASITSILDAAVIRDGVIEMDIPYASFSMLGTAADDRIFYSIYQEKKVLSGYENLKLPELLPGASSIFRTTEFMGVPVRQVTASRVLAGADLRTTITATVAQTQDSLSGSLSRISRNAAVLGAGFFTVAVLLSIWATSTTIWPLKRLAESVTRRGPHDLSPVEKPVPSEMAPLVSSLNNLMGRLDKSLNQSEEFIAEAAHRVQTPLATVRSHAEVTLQRVDKDENRQALRSMIRALDEASRAAGQLLDHAMITFRANQLEYHQIDLVDTMKDVVLRLTPVADMKDVMLRLNGEQSVIVSGDPILIQNAVRNLIDNALKYSPIESVILITVASSPTPNISIKDQGPGFPIDEINVLKNRFARGRNSIGTIGSGLGLTIARDVANAHDGELTMRNVKGGGACVTLSF